MKRKPRRKRLPHHHGAAFREAGHAVAAWQRHVMLMPISIFTTGKGAGRNVWHQPLRNVDFDWVRTEDSSALVERLASILLSGPLAESLFGPGLQRGTTSAERIGAARTLLNAVPPRTGATKTRYRKVRGETEKFLKEPRVRGAIAALACELLERGTVRGGEAARIIEEHFERPRHQGPPYARRRSPAGR